MKSWRKIISNLILGFAFFLLVLDSKTVLTGAGTGINLCLNTVIPSLFPFLILSKIICAVFSKSGISWLHFIGKRLGIPQGGESLLLLSVLGGYPVGAQNIYDAFEHGQLDKKTARRLLAFCSNAGPAFIFGMVSSLFSAPLIPWIIWIIHIASSFIVGLVIPGKASSSCSLMHVKRITISDALNSSIKVMAVICGWVIIFRVIITALQRWILWLVPQPWHILVIGFLELSNGCYELFRVTDEGTRFILVCGFLAFGGICVGMQTVSITRELGTGFYFPGKLMQAGISILLSGTLSFLIYPPKDMGVLAVILAITFCITAGYILAFKHKSKKTVAILC